MTELFKSISNYHFFNYLLPGAILTYYLEKLYKFSLNDSNIVILFCIYYVAGLLISRIGALVISLLPKCVLDFQPYDKYLKASQKDPAIIGMNTIANMYRTMSILFVLILIFTIIHQKTFSSICKLSILCTILLIYSYVKQINLIVKRIKIVLEKPKDPQNVEK